MMRRTIEVGRAVLSSPSTHRELWLTTLITLSQQQHQQLIDFEQLSVDSLLGHLSSGNIWVGHERDVYVEFRFTYRKEPLANQPLETLIASILSAPVSACLEMRFYLLT
jgi:hypothetical protein